MSDLQKQRSRASGLGSEMTQQARTGHDDLTLQQLLVNYMALPEKAMIEVGGRLFMTRDSQRYMTAIVERSRRSAVRSTSSKPLRRSRAGGSYEFLWHAVRASAKAHRAGGG